MRFGQPSAGDRTSPSFGRAGGIAGLAVIVLVAGGILWSAAATNAATARHPVLFGGSVVLEDSRPLTVVDLATAKVTVRLPGIDQQVDAAAYSAVQAVPVDEGTMLVNRKTGTFNLLQQDNYVLDSSGAGVGLGRLAGATAAVGYPAGADTYIVRTAPNSTVSLVGEQTVAEASRVEAAASAVRSRAAPSEISPLGFAALGAPVSTRPGSATVAQGDLWVLVPSHAGCQIDQLHPVANAHQGLTITTRGTEAVGCTNVSLESASGLVGAAIPGWITLFTPAGPERGLSVAVPASSAAVSLLPVTGATNGLWYLARSANGWSMLAVTPTGKVTGPAVVTGLSSDANPVAPAMSHGRLYTLDQAANGQPTLWAIDAASGTMAPVAGAATYPAYSATEKASFRGAQVVVDGPRVVFNNPGSLEAVVVFTDGSRSPVVVNKAAAVAISSTGPADVNIAPNAKPKAGRGSATNPAGRAVPVVQQVSQQVTCRNTTQKPYAPQITGITPSSQAASVSWSYQLLDQTDCEPDSWSVQMTALTGSHQPTQPLQTENGQEQYLFTGLRPATTYRAVVTAYINKESTPSAPITFTTPARGPDAPLSVSTTSDGRGDWVVSWKPCTEAVNPNCVVPADVWNITGAACGSSFVGSNPPAVQVPGHEDTITIDSDSLGLLGDSLTFAVQGALASGLSGNPTSDHSCTQAWRPPNSSAITLSGSGTPAGQTITGTLEVKTKEAPVEAFGSQSTEFVYTVGGRTIGPTSHTTVTFPGLAAGQTYTPTVTIYPTGHQSASVSVTGAPFSQNLSWPADLGIQVNPSVDANNPNQGSLAVTFPNLPPGPMSASGSYTCGSTQSQQVSGPVVNGTFDISIDLIQYGGACDLTVALDDTASPDPYGVSSPQLPGSFDIGQQPGYQFSDQIAPGCQKNFCVPVQLEVDFGGPGAQPSAGAAWSMTSSDQQDTRGGVDPCASSENIGDQPHFPQTLTLPVTCLHPNQVDVTVSYTYLGTVTKVDAGSPNGTPATTTTTVCTTSTSVSTTTACTSAGSQAAAYVAAPGAGSRALGRAVGSGAAGLGFGWVAVSVRRLRTKAKKGHR